MAVLLRPLEEVLEARGGEIRAEDRPRVGYTVGKQKRPGGGYTPERLEASLTVTLRPDED